MRIDRVRALVMRDDHVLQVYQRIMGMGFTPRGAYRWILPGGGIDPGETPEEALRRELREEATVDVEVGPLLYTLETGNGVHGIFRAFGDGEPVLGGDEPDVDRVAWRPLVDANDDFMVARALRQLDEQRDPVPHVSRRGYGFITRGRHLCVFDHVGAPEAGTQVPGGGINGAETTLEGVVREVREETGFEAEVLDVLATLDDPEADALTTGLHLRFTQDVPETWDHGELGGDEPIPFRFRWIPLEEAERALHPRFARFIPALLASLE